MGPRRRWYVVAAVMAAGGVLAAAALSSLVPFGGRLGQAIAPGQAVTLHVPEAGKMVWTAADASDVGDLRCEPAGQPVSWSAEYVWSADLTLDADGRQWRGALILRAEPAGAYAVTCTTATGAPMAVGDPPRFADARSQALAAVAATLVAAAGLVGGTVLALVVAIRRRRTATSGGEPIRR